jgi:hypothetical protein
MPSYGKTRKASDIATWDDISKVEELAQSWWDSLAAFRVNKDN